MTITTNDTRDEYTATAGQTVFNYTFKIFAGTDLLVYQTAAGAIPDDTTDLITAYTVTGVGNAGGGTIVLDTGAALNDKITIVSNISYERDTDYQFNGDYTAEVVNYEQDKQLSLIKQVKEEVSRTMQFPRAAQSATGKVLPQPSDLADCVLAFDSNGDPVAGPSATSMQALIDAAEAVIANSNAGAVSATHTSWDASWTFTDVQGFMNQLCYSTTGDFPSIMRGLNIRSVAGTGVDTQLSQASLKIGSATTGRYFQISDTLGNVFTLYAVDATATKQAFISIGDYFQAQLFGHDSELEFDETDGSLKIGGTSVMTFAKTTGVEVPKLTASTSLQLPSYANLAAINAAIPSPAHGMMVMTASQGMAVYKTSSWVRAVDETTAIT